MSEGPAEPTQDQPVADAAVPTLRPNGRDVAWIMAGVLLGYAVGALLFLFVLWLLQGSTHWKETTVFTASAYVAQALILTLPVVVIGVRWRGIAWEQLGFRRPAARW